MQIGCKEQLSVAVWCACRAVDQLSVDKALEVLSYRTDRMFDAPLGITELSEYLLALCGHLQTQRINAALTIDLLLNWLLNVYDKSVTAASLSTGSRAAKIKRPSVDVSVCARLCVCPQFAN